MAQDRLTAIDPAAERRIPAPLAARLAHVRGRIRTRFFVHGSGVVLAATAGLLLAHLALDRLLVLPVFVRIVLLVALAVWIAIAVRRHLLYPLRRRLAIADIALLVERNHPELSQELISAVQLDPAAAHGDSPALIERVQADAATHVAGIDLRGLMRAQTTARAWGGAALALVLLGGAGALAPDAFSIWLRRLVGASTPYPRKTFLTLEVPEEQGNYTVDTSGEGPIRVALARGADLPINVDVEGRVPSQIELVVQARDDAGGTRREAMSQRSATHFRYVFRRLLAPIELHAVGGDDPGTRAVAVTILTPPTVTDLAVEIEPPAYTGRPVERREGGLVEALPQSRVRVQCRSTEPLASATLHFQESNTRLALERATTAGTPPNGSGSTAAGDGPSAGPIWQATFAMPASADRYRIQLVAENGLKQLAPGLYSVIPIPDRKPRLRLFAPGSSLQALTPQASFPLRLVADDDYGLTRIVLTTQIGRQEAPSEHALFALPPGGERALKQNVLQLFSPREQMPLDRPPREGDRITFHAWAEDNREPEAQKGAEQVFRIDLLEIEELRRRLQARLRGTRRTVERALKVQEEQEARTQGFLAELTEGNGIAEARRKLGLAATESGQQRVRGFLLQIRGDFGEVIDAHLFNGLDASPAVTDVIALYMAYFGEHPELPSNDPGFYVALDAGRKSGRIGNLDLIGRIGDMFMIAHRTLEEQVAGSLRALAVASTADRDDKFHAAMVEVGQRQVETVKGLRELLHLLEDWNDYQDVVRMARRLLRAEQDLIDRIRAGTMPKEDKR